MITAFLDHCAISCRSERSVGTSGTAQLLNPKPPNPKSLNPGPEPPRGFSKVRLQAFRVSGVGFGSDFGIGGVGFRRVAGLSRVSGWSSTGSAFVLNQRV